MSARRGGDPDCKDGESGPAPAWELLRQDDNGNTFGMGRFATEEEAQQLAARYAAGGHKQTYPVQRILSGD